MKVVLTGASGPLGRALVWSFGRTATTSSGSCGGRRSPRTRRAGTPRRAPSTAARVRRGASSSSTSPARRPAHRPWTAAHAARRHGQPGPGHHDDRQGGRGRRRAAAAVNASGVGLYGNPGDQVLDESAAVGSSFIAEVARRWEASTARREGSARVAHLRTSPVVTAKDGAFGSRLLPDLPARHRRTDRVRAPVVRWIALAGLRPSRPLPRRPRRHPGTGQRHGPRAA